VRHTNYHPTVLDNEHTRGLLCTAAALLACLLLVNFWPVPADSNQLAPLYSSTGQETIQIEEIVQTRQAMKAPPPAPLVPIVVPDEVLLEETELVFDNDYLETANLLEVTAAPRQGEPNPLPKPSVDAKLVRMVEPEYTREARRRKVRAEVVVEVLVSERGVVQDARVRERYLLGKDRNDRQSVAEIGFGLEESALEAARQSRFRPAREDGQAVASWTPLIFSFGV
jgi:protein TonB